MRRIRVIVADDHPTFREGLCRLLKDEDDMEVIATAANGEEAVTLAKEMQPDVMTIDIAMPGLSGVEATKQIKEACSKVAILMVSGYNYDHYVLASLRAGAAGYLLKDAPFRDLISAIRMVHNGEAVFDLKAAGRILHRLHTGIGENEGQRAPTELHSREMEVLKLAAKGMTNKQVGKRLVISERTVQTHLVNILRKLNVGSRTEAVLKALRLGLLNLEDLP